MPRDPGSDVGGCLERMEGCGLRLADASSDLRGRAVRTWAGAPVGQVDGLIVDPETRSVRLLEVGSGGVLGWGRRHRFVPVEAIVHVAADEVRIEAPDRDPPWRPRYAPRLIPEEAGAARVGLASPLACWAWAFVYPIREAWPAGREDVDASRADLEDDREEHVPT